MTNGLNDGLREPSTVYSHFLCKLLLELSELFISLNINLILKGAQRRYFGLFHFSLNF